MACKRSAVRSRYSPPKKHCTSFEVRCFSFFVPAKRSGVHRSPCRRASDTPDLHNSRHLPRRFNRGFRGQHGSRPDSARTSVAGFGRSESSKATWAAKGYEKQQKDAIIIENLRTAAKLPKTAAIHLKPTAINIDSLTFDDAHINQERSHNVSEKQAKQYIRDAKISVTVWNGQFERYYGAEGSAYVRTGTNEIRTAFSRDQYDENTTALVKEMKKNGLLG